MHLKDKASRGRSLVPCEPKKTWQVLTPFPTLEIWVPKRVWKKMGKKQHIPFWLPIETASPETGPPLQSRGTYAMHEARGAQVRAPPAYCRTAGPHSDQVPRTEPSGGFLPPILFSTSSFFSFVHHPVSTSSLIIGQPCFFSRPTSAYIILAVVSFSMLNHPSFLQPVVSPVFLSGSSRPSRLNSPRLWDLLTILFVDQHGKPKVLGLIPFPFSAILLSHTGCLQPASLWSGLLVPCIRLLPPGCSRVFF